MPALVVLIFAGVLVGAGIYLALERTLTRVFIGLALVTNGINVLILSMGGPAGLPPLLGAESDVIVDPLPQALILTSIVLSLGTTSFGLALAYRSWRLTGHDEVVDDVEDRRVGRRRRQEQEEYGVTGTEDPRVDYDLGGNLPAGQKPETQKPVTQGAGSRESESRELGSRKSGPREPGTGKQSANNHGVKKRGVGEGE